MSRSRFIASLLLVLCVAGKQAVADDVDSIRQSSEAFAKAFDLGNAQALAALWTPDGKLVDATGRVFKGRAEIAAAYAKFFAVHPGEKIKVSVDSIQLLGESAALEQGSASLESAGAEGTESGATYTAVHIKQDGKWLMAFVHEASAATPDSASLLKDLDWMVGKWTAEEYGATMTVECRWLPNNSFLERKFTLHTPDNLTTAGMMLIGIDPRTGGVASWNFNFDGSHAVAAWMPIPRGWAIHSVGLLPDGTETHAVNVLTRLDDNAYSWQSVDRSVGLQQLPNVGEIILRRATLAKETAAKK